MPGSRTTASCSSQRWRSDSHLSTGFSWRALGQARSGQGESRGKLCDSSSSDAAFGIHGTAGRPWPWLRIDKAMSSPVGSRSPKWAQGMSAGTRAIKRVASAVFRPGACTRSSHGGAGKSTNAPMFSTVKMSWGITPATCQRRPNARSGTRTSPNTACRPSIGSRSPSSLAICKPTLARNLKPSSLVRTIPSGGPLEPDLECAPAHADQVLRFSSHIPCGSLGSSQNSENKAR